MSFSTCLTGKTNLDTNSDTVVIPADDIAGKYCRKKRTEKKSTELKICSP